MNYYNSNQKQIIRKQQTYIQQQPSFQGKHSSAKFLGGLFGALGTLGAIGGTIIMTGGVALPMVLGYGALSAGSGAILGNIIDKGAEKAEKKMKEESNK
jgi:hypothetical protein